MLAPPLRQLLRMQALGVVRQGFRRTRTLRGALLFAIGVLVFLAWLWPTLQFADVDKPRVESVRLVMPMFILGVTLVTALSSAGEKAIAFTGGETDQLFPGPFTRRQLVIYKLVKGAGVAVLTGLIVSVAIYRNATIWIACYVGSVLALLFAQLTGTAALLAGEAVGHRWRNRGRLVVGVAVLALLYLAVRSAGGENWWTALMTDPRPVFMRAAESTPGRVLLAPFAALTAAITAERIFPDLLIWGGVGVAMNGLMAAAVLALDGRFVEAAAAASERRHERLRRLKSGGAMAMTARAVARRSLPMLPRWGGAGLIAWRQLVHASRASRVLLIVLAVLVMAVGPILVAGARARDPSSALFAVIAVLAWMSVLLAAVLRFDFRADLDVIETLKTLPLSPSAVAAGQLVTPTIVMTLLHWLVIGATLAVGQSVPAAASARGPLLVALVVALPFNILMFAAENLIFLMAPTRPIGAGPGDFALLGRQILTLVIRTVVVGCGVAIAGGAAAAAYIVGRDVLNYDSLIPATIVGVLFLLIESAVMIPLVGVAYARFDPSRHMPG